MEGDIREQAYVAGGRQGRVAREEFEVGEAGSRRDEALVVPAVAGEKRSRQREGIAFTDGLEEALVRGSGEYRDLVEALRPPGPAAGGDQPVFDSRIVAFL